VFIARYKREGQRFEFPTDKQWNELGQRVVAQELERSSVFQQVFRAPAMTTATAAGR